MKLGFIGLGIMGEAMCSNLIKKSLKEVYVFDRTQEKVLELVDIGAVATSSIEELGAKADIVFTMVPKSQDVLDVYKELLKVAKMGQIFVDMSTIDPKVSIEVSSRVAQNGAIMLDAPVVKSRPAALSGTLGIYVGGDYETYIKIKDLLLCMGSNIIHMGPNGTGLTMKICHNMLVAQIQNGVNEMITLAKSCGIDVEDFTTAIGYGGGQNFYLDGKSKAIQEGNFSPAFSLENMHKDIGIAMSLAKEQGLKLGGMSLVADVYEKAMDLELGREDFSATFKVVNHQSENNQSVNNQSENNHLGRNL